MKQNLFIPVISILTLFSACTKHNSEAQNEPYIVNFEQCMATEQAMKISEIADTIEYLELKTPKDIIIARILNIIPGDDFWIIHTKDGIFKFTKEGEFVREIGRKGQGPGEYLRILGIEIDRARKEIIHADMQQVLFYDLEGNFLRSAKINDYFFNIAFSDSVLWTCNLCLHIDKYMACALNREGDTIASMPNPNYGMESLNTDGFYFNSSTDLREFSRYNGALYMKTRASNDTVFQLSGSKWTPYLYFDMGKYKMPVEYEMWYSKEAYEKNATRYWNIPRLEEDDRYLYLTAVRQKSTNEIRGHADDHKYIVYDKEKEQGFVTKGETGIKITDDILGGPAIWPRWVSDDYYISTVEWYSLSEELKNGNYTLDPTFKKQFDSWGHDTNQLILLCRKRK